MARVKGSAAADVPSGSSLGRMPDVSLAPQLLARAQREGLHLADEPVLLWRDGDVVHRDICSPAVTRQVVTLEQAAQLLADEPRSWCSCGGVALAAPVQLLWRLHLLWQIVDDGFDFPGSWAELAFRVDALRPALTPPPYPPQADAHVQLGPLIARATSALWGQMCRGAAELDPAVLLRALAAPQVRVTVDAGQALLLARWAESQHLWGGSQSRRESPVRRPPLFSIFDEAADRQLMSCGGQVLVDLGSGPARAEELLTGSHPLPVVLLVSAGLAQVAGSRVWGNLPLLVACSLQQTLRLPEGCVASRTVRCERTLETMGRLTQMLQQGRPLDDVIVLAEDAL